MTSWSELKQSINSMMSRDPQRATLSQRAMAQVEEGLRHLAQVGYPFELVPRGALGAMRAEIEGSRLPRPMSIEDAMEHVQPGVTAQPGSETFNAK